MLLLYKGNGKRENKNKNWGFPKKKKKKLNEHLLNTKRKREWQKEQKKIDKTTRCDEQCS